MTSIRTRPRFRFISKQTENELKNSINNYLSEFPKEGVNGKVFDDHCSFSISLSERHFWSPYLNVTFDSDEEEGGTIIRGRYGPAPNIWTIFMFVYSTLGFSVIFIGLYGLSQLALNHSAGILWLLPFLLIGILILWLIGQTGQKIGVEQTFRIHQFFEKAIDEKIHIS